MQHTTEDKIELQLKSSNEPLTDSLSAMNLEEVFNSVQVPKAELEVRCNKSEDSYIEEKSEVSDESEHLEIELPNDNEVDFEVVKANDSDDEYEPKKWVQTTDKKVYTLQKSGSESSSDSNKAEGLDFATKLSLDADEQEDKEALDNSVDFEKVQINDNSLSKSSNSVKSKESQDKEQELDLSYCYTNSGKEDNEQEHEPSNMTIDFNDLANLEDDPLSNGISKLRESYLEASKEVYDCLKCISGMN